GSAPYRTFRSPIIILFILICRRLISTLSPYTTLFRSRIRGIVADAVGNRGREEVAVPVLMLKPFTIERGTPGGSTHEKAARLDIDRKSTRLNSSHVKSSYHVFCFKKKNGAQTGIDPAD